MADVTVSVTGQPLVLPQMTCGQTYTADFTGLIGGIPINFTTYTSATWDMALGPAPSPITLSAVTNPPGNGYLVWNASGGIVMTIPPGVTAAIAGNFPVGLTYYWELKIIDASQNVSKPIGGTILVVSTIAA